MKLQPLKDKILVKPEPRIQSTLWIKTAEADTIGTDVAVGPGRWLDDGTFEENPLKGGERVTFGTLAKDYKDEYLKFQEWMEDGERYLLMSWQDVCGVMNAEEIN